jgi:hypothetical protein
MGPPCSFVAETLLLIYIFTVAVLANQEALAADKCQEIADQYQSCDSEMTHSD